MLSDRHYCRTYLAPQTPPYRARRELSVALCESHGAQLMDKELTCLLLHHNPIRQSMNA